jgi:hypothetical protein
MDHHRQIADALAAKGIAIQLHPLDPIPSFDVAGWAERHQQDHSAFTGALGIAGLDHSGVDFTNRTQLEIWIRLHGSEHRQAEDILGLGR